MAQDKESNYGEFAKNRYNYDLRFLAIKSEASLQNGFILLRTDESMLFASPASLRAILAVALAVVRAP